MNVAGAGRILLWGMAAILAVALLFLVRGHLLKADPVILESYEVPQEIASELELALTFALRRGPSEEPLGRVSKMPDGRLVVTAPVSVQAGVRHVLDEVTANKPVPTPTIGFDVWIVTASPGGRASPSGALTEIEPALAVIRETRGVSGFELLEKLSTVARAGHDASTVRGALAQMTVEASLRRAEDSQPVVAAKLRVSVPGNASRQLGAALEAQTELRPGELLVVGQSGLSATGDSLAADTQVFYIVRATL